MDAADDDSGAQPWSDKHRQKDSTSPGTDLAGFKETATSSVEKAARTSNTVFDLFDVQTGKGEASVVPCTVPIFDMAAVDDDCSVLAGADSQAVDPPGSATSEPAAKQFQDDLSTPGLHRKPWAEVEDEDDPSGYRFFDVIAEDAAADDESQEHRTQCGPSVTTSQVFDTGAGLVRQQHAGSVGAVSVLPVLPMTPPDEGEAGSVCRSVARPLGHVNSEGAVELDGAPLAAAGCFEGEPCALDESDTLGYDFYSGPQSDITASFQEFARTMLPDVYPSSDHSEPSLDGDPCAEELSPDGDVEPLPLRGTGSPGTSPGGGQGNVGTQCGPQTLRTQCGPVPLDDDHGFFPDFNVVKPDGFPQTTRTQCGPLPLEADSPQTSRTQCGPLPHGHDSFHAYAAEAAPSQDDVKRDAQCPQTSRTQCGPLPLDDDHGFFPNGGSIVDYDPFDAFDAGRLKDESAQCGPMPQSQSSGSPTSRTQCGPLPQQHSPRASCDPLAGLQTSLQQLLDVSLEPNRASLDTRATFLEAYAAATRQFELEFGLDDSPGTKDMSSLGDLGDAKPSPGTPQCGPPPLEQSGPLPSAAASRRLCVDTGCQFLLAPTGCQFPLAPGAPQTSRTQCGPSPLGHRASAAATSTLGPSSRQLVNERSNDHPDSKPRLTLKRGRRNT